jgi:RimJ/RimL family protein N-acetyltransferase
MDPETVEQSFSRSPEDPLEFQDWYIARYLGVKYQRQIDKTTLAYFIEGVVDGGSTDPELIGFIVLDKITDNAYGIGIVIAPELRGLGFATKGLKLARAEVSVKIIANIKPDNVASERAFNNAGYVISTMLMGVSEPEGPERRD